MNIQKTHSSNNENFAYKISIQKIAVSDLFSVNAFNFTEPLFIVKFTSHLTKTSAWDTLPSEEMKQTYVKQGLLFQSQIAELEKNPSNFSTVFHTSQHKEPILLVKKEYCNAFANFGINTSMSKEFMSFQESQNSQNEQIFDVVTASTFNLVDYELIRFNPEGYRSSFLDSSNNLWIEPIYFNYIDGNVSNKYYDLNIVKDMLLANPDICLDFKISYSNHKYVNSSDLSNAEKKLIIQEIPYYNQDDELRTHFISFYWKPNHSLTKEILAVSHKNDKRIKKLSENGVSSVYDWRSYLFYELLNGKSAVVK